MKKLYYSSIIFLIIQVNTLGQWEEIHLPDTTFFQQLGVSELVECNGILIAHRDHLFSSSNEGATWERLPFEKAANHLYSTGQILFLDTYDGQFFRSLDNGYTWINIDTTFLLYNSLPEPNDVYTIAIINSFAFDSNEIFVGTDAGIFQSQNNGISWTPSSDGLPYDYYNLHFTRITSLLITGSKMYAGTEDRGIYISTDNGHSWRSINDGLVESSGDYTYLPTIRAIIYNGTAVFALAGNIYRLNGNNIWEKTQIGIQGSGVFSIAYKDSILFALTLEALYSSHDNGNNWNEIYSSSLFQSGSSVGIKIFNSGFYLFGVDFGVYSSSDNGISWNSRNEGLGEFEIKYPSTIDVYNSILGVITNDLKTYISLDGGNNWEKVTLADTSIINLINNDTNFFSLFNSIFIKRKGVWVQISNIINGSVIYGFTIDFVLADTTLIGIHQEFNLAEIYRCGINSGFIQNNIFQPAWKLSLTGSYYHPLIVNKNNIYVGASDGIYLSTDFGVIWTQIGLTDKRISNLVLSGTNLIIQTNDGAYKSFDGGYNWFPSQFGSGQNY